MDMRFLSHLLWLAQLGASPEGGTTPAPRADFAGLVARLRGPAPAVAPAAPAAPAAPFARETADYRVSFGILGQVARATISYAPAPGGNGGLVRAVGAGGGAVLGFGETQKRIESELDLGARAARRWKSVRSTAGQVTVDNAEQPSPGNVSLVRQKTGEPDRADHFTRAAPVMDALSFLLRLRLALPTAPSTFEILDGRALWIAEISPARPDPEDDDLLRVEGKIRPVFWSGGPDPKRKSHSFWLAFTRDRHHTPTRLVVPFGLGEVRAELVRVERGEPERDQAFGRRETCARFLGRALCNGFLFPQAPTSR